METETGVVQWMKSIAVAYEEFGKQGHKIGNSLEGWVLKHGHQVGPRIPLPEGVSWMTARMCFSNAFNLAVYDDHDRFTYMEGYAYTPGIIAVHHAWVVNDKDEVIDPTWMDGGKLCAFCLGDKQVVLNICCVCEQDQEECSHDPDEDGYYEDERDCWSCEGTGESDHEHPSREGCSYYGIKIERDELIAMTLKKGCYGILPDCINELNQKFLDLEV